MRSRTSFFNLTLFRKDLTRFWPLWAVYGVIWLVMVPLSQFLTLFGASARYNTQEELAAQTAYSLLNSGTEMALWMALIFGCLFAMALYSYLYSARSTGMMHSFPIRREGLFLTHYLAGVAVFMGTLAVCGVLAAVIQGAAGMLVWKNIGLWFVCAAGQMLFFYSFAVFCAMFTGQVLAVPVFYAVFNGLAMVLTTTVQSFASKFLYGYDGGGYPVWVSWLTPVLKLERTLGIERVWNESQTYRDASYYAVTGVSGLGTLAVYALAGLVLAVLALVVYRLRRSETAGDTVSVGWAKQLFRFGVAACAALTLGQALESIIYNEFFYRDTARHSLAVALVCMGLLALAGFFAAEMLLKKSFRVLRTGWKGAALTLLAVAALGACVGLDLTGVERRVPDQATGLRFSIHNYGFNYLSGHVTDPETIQKFQDLHRAFIAGKDAQLAREEHYRFNEEETAYTGALSLTYELGGTSVRRSYEVDYQPEDLEDPNSLVSQLAALACDPAVQRAGLMDGSSAASLEQLEEALITGELTYIRPVYEDGSWSDAARPFDEDAARTVFQALLRDVDAGRAGISQFSHDPEAAAYLNDLVFYYEQARPGREPVRQDLRVNISPAYTETIAALTELGIVNEERPLLTREQLKAYTD